MEFAGSGRLERKTSPLPAVSCHEVEGINGEAGRPSAFVFAQFEAVREPGANLS